MVYHHFCCKHLQIWTVNLILDRCTYQSSHTIGSIGDIPQAIFTLWSVMHCFKKHMYTVPRAERQRWTANSSMAVTKKGVRRLRWLGFCCDVHLKNPQFGWFEPWHVIFDGSKPMKLPYLRDFSPPLTSYLFGYPSPWTPWTLGPGDAKSMPNKSPGSPGAQLKQIMGVPFK